MLAAELEEIFAGETKQRQAEQAWQNQPQSQKVANLPPLEKAKARDEEHLASLQIDYRQMAVMIFGTIPEFNQIIDTLSQLENEINQLSPDSSDKDT